MGEGGSWMCLAKLPWDTKFKWKCPGTFKEAIKQSTFIYEHLAGEKELSNRPHYFEGR